MAITPGTDTWATVDEADAILNNIVGSAPWHSLPDANVNPGDESKEAYLVTAFEWISSMYGIPASASAPVALKKAQAFAANWLIENRIDYEKRSALIASGVEQFEWSRWKETLGDGVSTPRIITDLLIDLGIGAGNQTVQLYGDDYE